VIDELTRLRGIEARLQALLDKVRDQRQQIADVTPKNLGQEVHQDELLLRQDALIAELDAVLDERKVTT
jgi:hypothetical protein